MITSSKRNERLKAELSSLKAQLDRIPLHDAINRISIQMEISDLEDQLKQLPDREVATPFDDEAFVDFAFSGDPVVAQRGIDLKFSGSFLSDFQDLVSSIVAARQGESGSRGPSRGYSETRLHITGIIRGSFGFRIEPISQQFEMFEAETSNALDLATRMLKEVSSSENNSIENEFSNDIDDRVLRNLEKVFLSLESSNAQVEFKTKLLSHRITSHEIEYSRRNLDVTEISEADVEFRGVLNGLLPETHRFELEVGGDVISGPVAKKIEARELKEWLDRYLNQSVSVFLRERKVFRSKKLKRTTYTLIGIK